MDGGATREESEKQRLNRELEQLLQELRVAMPGVQVLFAFLLAVPFQQRFTQVTPLQKDVYFATLLMSALASALFIAPTAYHRITFRRHEKEHLIKLSTRFAIAGLAALALAMCGAILLVTDVLFDATAVIVATAASLVLFGGLWFALGIRGLIAARGAGS
jgi:cation transport ATPase